MKNFFVAAALVCFMPGASASAVVEQYTYFEYEYSWGGPGFSYLNDVNTGEPYIVKEFSTFSSTGFTLFLQFEGLLDLSAVSGKTFGFGTGSPSDPKVRYSDWRCESPSWCADSPPAGRVHVEVTFSEYGLPTLWDIINLFSYGDGLLFSSEEKDIPPELVALGIGSSTYFDSIRTQENKVNPDSFFFSRGTWTGRSGYICAYDSESIDCGLPDIGHIVAPVPVPVPVPATAWLSLSFLAVLASLRTRMKKRTKQLLVMQ